jgi:uncharacterized phiE125 gp8 family phage protein
MALVLTSGPAVEPVSLVEAKSHLRVETSAEDALIGSLITTSRLHIEAALDLALIEQSWTWSIDTWPHRRPLYLPLRPVVQIDAINIIDATDTPHLLAASAYHLDGNAVPARLSWLAASSPPRPGRPASGIEISFTAGFGSLASDVPGPIRQALLLLIAHWYEQREPVATGSAATPIPTMISDLLAPYRSRRI